MTSGDQPALKNDQNSSVMIFDAFRMPLTQCCYVAQGLSERGGSQEPPPHQVVENLETQQGVG